MRVVDAATLSRLTPSQLSSQRAYQAQDILRRLKRGDFSEDDNATIEIFENQKIGTCARVSEIALGWLAYIVSFCSLKSERALLRERALCIVQGALSHELKGVEPKSFAKKRY